MFNIIYIHGTPQNEEPNEAMPVNYQLTSDQAFFSFFPLKEKQTKFNYKK